MKNIVLALAMCLALNSCKDNPVSKKINETKEGITNASKAVKELNKIQEGITELQEVEPLTNDDLKAWLPNNVKGLKRIAFKAGQMAVMQIASIEATYANDDKSKTFKIEVIDGAGTMGATATAGMRMLFSQDFEEEDEYKTRRTTERNGVKAIEEYRKSKSDIEEVNSRSTIELMQDERFYIKATGTNMSIDDTWDAIEDMGLEDLI
jgi:hypothetical protein